MIKRQIHFQGAITKCPRKVKTCVANRLVPKYNYYALMPSTLATTLHFPIYPVLCSYSLIIVTIKVHSYIDTNPLCCL